MRGIVASLATVLLLAGCTDDAKPEPDPPPQVPSAPTPTPTPSAPPDDHDLGVALPNSIQMGQIDGYTDCISGVDSCNWPGVIGASPDPTLSWARAEEGNRWAELIVSRQAQPTLRGRFVADMKVSCPRGDWFLPADPRGFQPRPATEGTSRRLPVEHDGFRGLRCVMDSGVVGQPRHETHSIRAVRDDVQLEVSASSEALALRLFEEYVDRLG